MSIFLRLWVFVLTFSLVACSGGGSNSRLDYKESKSLSTLDMPPNLIAPQNTGETELPSGPQSGTATEAAPGSIFTPAQGVRIGRDGMNRWLVVNMEREQLWSRLRGFWGTLGLELEIDEPALAIMETAWAENRADAPSGFIADMVKRVFKNAYAAGTRDKYRLRLEPGENNSTEIYVTHYGLKEVVKNQDGDEILLTAWEVRPSDRELVNEVLNRLVLYLGGSGQVAARVQAKAPQEEPERARIDGEVLVIDEGFARSWRLVGLALDNLGVVVEDRNRSQGIYYVSKIELLPEEEQKGWFGKLFSAKKEESAADEPQTKVEVRGGDSMTMVQIFNLDGTPRRDEMAVDLLKRLHGELK